MYEEVLHAVLDLTFYDHTELVADVINVVLRMHSHRVDLYNLANQKVLHALPLPLLSASSSLFALNSSSLFALN